MVGHAGDGGRLLFLSVLCMYPLRAIWRNGNPGNFHTLLLFKTDAELKVVRDLVHRMVHRAIALDGTCA